jgi:mannose-6-phosphate isomerase-like protein (cupin superfamily)
MKVDKPWGHEIRWAINDKYLGKILRIEPGQKLSRQYHEQKDETVYVLEGVLVMELGQDEDQERIIMKPGTSRRIMPGTIHRFCAPSDGCTLIEVSTPEIDDVVRLHDDYGRK